MASPTSGHLRHAFNTPLTDMLGQILQRLAVLLAIFTISGTARAEITVSPVARGYDIDITEQTSSTALIDALSAAIGVTVAGYPPEKTIAKGQLRGASLERAVRALLPQARFVVRFNADNTPSTIIFLSTGQGEDSDMDGDTGSDMEDLSDPSADAANDSARDFIAGPEPEPDMQP